MRIFHLSDLHIGIRLYNYDLREEQEYIFNEIIEKMQEYKPDVIVIAGDIYDRAMPSGDAIEMFDRFINKIREEIKFNGLEELVNQLKIDKSYAEKNNIII